MRKDSSDDLESRARELLRQGVAAELTLLKQERKAEQRLATARSALAEDETRLRKAQSRLDRSREAVATAEATLRDFQARRAAGPEFAER
jgi:hypothetical protein